MIKRGWAGLICSTPCPQAHSLRPGGHPRAPSSRAGFPPVWPWWCPGHRLRLPYSSISDKALSVSGCPSPISCRKMCNSSSIFQIFTRLKRNLWSVGAGPRLTHAHGLYLAEKKPLGEQSRRAASRAAVQGLSVPLHQDWTRLFSHKAPTGGSPICKR